MTASFASGIIRLSPSYGNQLGGTPVMVSGTDVVFRERDDITCVFSDQRVEGVYINQEQALCVSPELSETGTIPFQLMIEDDSGSVPYIGEASYISCKSNYLDHNNNNYCTL